MPRRAYSEEYEPGNADYEYDEHRQRLLDALQEGREAGRLGLAADLCPYFPVGRVELALYNEWHKGRLQTLLENVKGRMHATK
jgi:hypothetical protein